MAGQDEIRVLTLNCWGIPYLSKECDFRISSIADELSKGQHDIVALQEIWVDYQYQEIKKKVSSVLPYSHYFHSGVIGTGLCIFSKYQIVDAFLHQFSANGQFYAVAEGDWFAGKGIGYCCIMHPSRKICVFNLHLHASYPSNSYTELRTLQAYQCAQFLSKMTRPEDAVILCGDFNHEETEIGVKIIKALSGLKDSWRSADKKPLGPSDTINTADNPYSAKNEKIQRIDFIFHSERLHCLENSLSMEDIPGSKCHFSDHKGVTAKFRIQDNHGENIMRDTANASAHKSRAKVLQELHDTISFGLKTAEEYKWTRIISIWILLFMFIFMPVFSEDGVYFMLPVLSRLSGEIVFFMQIVCIVISMSYFWILVILKKMEQSAYRNALLEIELKMNYDKHKDKEIESD